MPQFRRGTDEWYRKADRRSIYLYLCCDELILFKFLIGWLQVDEDYVTTLKQAHKPIAGLNKVCHFGIKIFFLILKLIEKHCMHRHW